MYVDPQDPGQQYICNMCKKTELIVLWPNLHSNSAIYYTFGVLLLVPDTYVLTHTYILLHTCVVTVCLILQDKSAKIKIMFYINLTLFGDKKMILKD